MSMISKVVATASAVLLLAAALASAEDKFFTSDVCGFAMWSVARVNPSCFFMAMAAGLRRCGPTRAFVDALSTQYRVIALDFRGYHRVSSAAKSSWRLSRHSWVVIVRNASA